MKNLFERASSYWVRYDEYELKEGQNGSFWRQCPNIPYCALRKADDCMGLSFAHAWDSYDVQFPTDR